MNSNTTQNYINPTEDFWSRQTNAQTETFEFGPFGIPAVITANQPDALTAARLSANRFSRAVAATTEQPITIRIVVRSGAAPPIPANLPEHLAYSGVGKWITVSAGEWGHGFANLETREAVIILSPQLAAKTRLISRYFIDHYLLNFILTEWAMLHASCVFSPDRKRLIVMIAPHNTGKSTTALHLLRAGYIFLADGMALVRQTGPGFLVGGYPIGEVKLRDDVLAMFPEYGGQSVQVREHQKTVVSLRKTHSNQLVETLIMPEAIQLCFVERADTSSSRVANLSVVEVLNLLAENTVFWDEPEQLAHNSRILQKLIRVASLYRLTIGTDVDNIIATMDELA